jgi:hypothetical protein
MGLDTRSLVWASAHWGNAATAKAQAARRRFIHFNPKMILDLDLFILLIK